MAGKGSLAEKIRVGLKEEKAVQLSLVTSTLQKDPLDGLYFRKTIRQHVKEFACVMSLVALAIAGYKIYRHADYSWGLGLIALALLILFLGYLTPHILRPIWRGWMYLAEKLGYVMSIVILSIAWTLALIPIAFMVKLFRARTMDLTFRTSVESYWEKRDPKYDDFQLLKRQF